MSNQNENIIWIWNNISPNSSDQDPKLWSSLKSKFGESGEPGFYESVSSVIFPDIFGHKESVQIFWTTYRSEIGELLAVHGYYLDDTGEQHPFILFVNPFHQRKGIGTMMANFVKDRYFEERKKQGDANASFTNIKLTPAGAQFLNKFVNEEYAKRNNQ